jgi:phosphoribosylformylglycinamidine cyclo-ligase
VAANDGVGTKLKVAIEAGIHDTVGIDLVAMCVNDLVVQGAEPLFFLDYFATGKLDGTGRGNRLRHRRRAACRPDARCSAAKRRKCPACTAMAITISPDSRSERPNAASCCPRARCRRRRDPRPRLLRGAFQRLFAGSADRRDVSGLDYDAPAPFDASRSLGAALLEPTRIYVKSVLAAIRGTGAIQALAHITGGGFPENMPRVLPEGMAADIDLDAIKAPRSFHGSPGPAASRRDEMLRTFNCGIGMIAVTPEADADRVIAALEAEGETVIRLGRLTQRTDNGPGVVYKGTLSL